jgi:hypothetical protein
MATMTLLRTLHALLRTTGRREANLAAYPKNTRARGSDRRRLRRKIHIIFLLIGAQRGNPQRVDGAMADGVVAT